MSALTVLVMLLLLAFWAGVFVYSRGPLRQLGQSVDRLERTVDRIEAAARVVASDLEGTKQDLVFAAEQREQQGAAIVRMEAADHVVAGNLADAHSRANATDGPDGAAADAALRTAD